MRSDVLPSQSGLGPGGGVLHLAEHGSGEGDQAVAERKGFGDLPDLVFDLVASDGPVIGVAALIMTAVARAPIPGTWFAVPFAIISGAPCGAFLDRWIGIRSTFKRAANAATIRSAAGGSSAAFALNAAAGGARSLRSLSQRPENPDESLRQCPVLRGHPTATRLEFCPVAETPSQHFGLIGVERVADTGLRRIEADAYGRRNL